MRRTSVAALCGALAALVIVAAPRVAAASDCAGVAVQIIETAPPGKPHRLRLKSVELRLLDPKGAVVAHAAPGPHEWMGPPPARQTFVEHQWPLPCLQPARYRLEVRYRFRGDRAPRVAALTVGLGRGEIDLRVSAGFTAKGAGGTPHLQLLTLTRLLPAVGARMRPQWTPHPDGEARYVLENRGPVPLYGVGPRGSFTGVIERFEPKRRAWVEVDRGTAVPPREAGPVLVPKGTALARELELAGRPRRLAPGRYRFVLEYQRTPLSRALSEAEKHGATIVRVHDRHRVTAEFVLR